MFSGIVVRDIGARALQVLGAPRLISSASRDNIKGGSAGMPTSWMDFHCRQEKGMNGGIGGLTLDGWMVIEMNETSMC